MMQVKRWITAVTCGLAVAAAVQAAVLPWTTKAMRVQASTSQSSPFFFPADLLIDFESGNIGDLISTQNLTASTHSVRPLGYWTVRYGNPTNAPDVPKFPSNLTIGASSAGYMVPAIVGTQLYSSAGTRGHMALMTNSYHNSMFTFGGAGYSNVSVGMWFTAPAAGLNEHKDIFTCKKGSGFSVIASSNDLTYSYVNMHTGAGKSSGIRLTPNARYWATLLLPFSNGIDTLQVYDESGVCIGTNTLNQPNTNSLHDMMWIGRADDTGNKVYSTVTVDNVVFDLEDASFPLGVAPNAQHSTSFADGFLLAENFEVNRRPLGFNNAGSGITWSTNVTGMESSSALRIDQSSGDVWYDLCNNYSNVYTYSQVRPDGFANYRYYTKFSSPVGAYADLIGVTLNFASKPSFYGVTGVSNVSSGASVSNGITYHVWTEFESGTVARCYWSTSATKPSAPTMQGPVGGASYTNTMIRYIHLNDGGKTQHDKWRISVVGPIGSNPQ